MTSLSSSYVEALGQLCNKKVKPLSSTSYKIKEQRYAILLHHR